MDSSRIKKIARKVPRTMSMGRGVCSLLGHLSGSRSPDYLREGHLEAVE